MNTYDLSKLEAITLKSGGHTSPEEGMCAMEAASYIAREEKFSDHPQCVCPTITGQVISVNDAIKDDARRTELIKPLIPYMLGTRVPKDAAGDAILLKRVYLCMDWTIRVRTPAFLRLAGLTAEAEALEQAATIVDQKSLDACNGLCNAAESAAWSATRSAASSAAESAARNAAWSAAYSAAESAAYSAAWSAAWSAAESAAESAAWSAARSAASSAAESAAWSAAWSAARSAARSAAESALEQTVREVQDSWAEMIKRMCEVGR